MQIFNFVVLYVIIALHTVLTLHISKNPFAYFHCLFLILGQWTFNYVYTRLYSPKLSLLTRLN